MNIKGQGLQVRKGQYMRALSARPKKFSGLNNTICKLTCEGLLPVVPVGCLCCCPVFPCLCASVCRLLVVGALSPVWVGQFPGVG